MKFNSIFILILSGAFLFGCGGSSGGTDASTDSVDNGGSGTDFASVSGVYAANHFNNENVLFIDNEGKITAYNYLGDSYDNGLSCYRKAIQNDTNYLLNDTQLQYDENTLQFYTEVEGSRLAWEMNTFGSVSLVLYDSLQGTEIIIESGKFVLSKELSSITEDQISSSLCN
ncbi:hypothetical protein GCE9029_01353 [Grimontia celer]|uniref:Lipoprotein n=1 Tax=Grimontia celer TaxID=1796497 RepID=A0A128EZ16_9GAMM|nr:hypothetical protein [Grimontia celer]CZF79246.1 hypothetical protein GCE9029_01353 [Grimontia celer]